MRRYFDIRRLPDRLSPRHAPRRHAAFIARLLPAMPPFL